MEKMSSGCSNQVFGENKEEMGGLVTLGKAYSISDKNENVSKTKTVNYIHGFRNPGKRKNIIK